MINEEEHHMPPKRRTTTTDTPPPDEAQTIVPVDTPPTEPAGQPDPPAPDQLEAASLAGLLGDHKELRDRVAALWEWALPHDGPTVTDEINSLGRRLDAAERELSTRGAINEASVPAIYAAVWAVMNDVQGVGKHGQMDPRSGMGNYQFRRYDDLKLALGAAVRRHGIMLQSEIIDVVNEHPFKDDRKTRVQVTMRYRFTSLQDGSAVAFETIGESIDTSDKASGKAMTMALKTALDQAFMLAAEDVEDPDASRPNEEPAEPPARREPYPTQADMNHAQRLAREYKVGDRVEVGGQTFVKHSDGPGFPNDQPKDTNNPWDQGPPPDTRTDQEKAQAAADRLNRPGVTMQDWQRISEAARQMGLYEVLVKVNGQEMALKHHLVAVGRTLA